MAYARARHYLEEGLAFCEAHDLITGGNFLLSGMGLWHLEQGRWSEAERVARRPLGGGDVSRITALRVVGLIQARRGEAGARRTLDDAHRLALRSGESRNLVPSALALAEAAWLRGDLAALRDAAAPALEAAVATRSRRWTGEAALWLHRAGRRGRVPAPVVEPYALHLAGRHHEAAAYWEAVGRPYDQADALADAPDPGAQRPGPRWCGGG